MKITKQAQNTVNELLGELTELGTFEFLAEHDNEGVCLHCGHIQDSVEPDATEYECIDCNELQVCGIETALMLFGV